MESSISPNYILIGSSGNLRQSQARFIHQKTGEEILVDAFLHAVSEYINEAISAGFSLVKAGEHRAEDDNLPRLLTLLFQKT